METLATKPTHRRQHASSKPLTNTTKHNQAPQGTTTIIWAQGGPEAHAMEHAIPKNTDNQQHGARTHMKGSHAPKDTYHAHIETLATKTTHERPHASNKHLTSTTSTSKPHMKTFDHNRRRTPPTKHPQSQMAIRTHHQAPPNTTQHPQAQQGTSEHKRA